MLPAPQALLPAPSMPSLYRASLSVCLSGVIGEGLRWVASAASQQVCMWRRWGRSHVGDKTGRPGSLRPGSQRGVRWRGSIRARRGAGLSTSGDRRGCVGGAGWPLGFRGRCWGRGRRHSDSEGARRGQAGERGRGARGAGAAQAAAKAQLVTVRDGDPVRHCICSEAA